MCGRYTLRRADLIAAASNAVPQPTFEEFTERPHFNLAPRQRLPVIRIDSQGRRVLELFDWGFVPHWTKAQPKVRPINARAETLASSGMFRQALERRRCLVPADGFYEWQGAKPPKRPYFIHQRDDSLFAFAGLWERWRPFPDDDPIDTFTIITTTPNDLMRPIHNRMPAILRAQDRDKWLDPQTPVPAAQALLRPSDAALEAVPVSTRVNSVGNDGPELIERTMPDS